MSEDDIDRLRALVESLEQQRDQAVRERDDVLAVSAQSIAIKISDPGYRRERDELKAALFAARDENREIRGFLRQAMDLLKSPMWAARIWCASDGTWVNDVEKLRAIMVEHERKMNENSEGPGHAGADDWSRCIRLESDRPR